MVDVTYDPEADAAYFSVGRGTIERQRSVAPFVLDVDADGRVIGIEILSASKVLAPGHWQNAQRPVGAASDAAE